MADGLLSHRPGARIPVVLGFLDYRRKAGGLGPVLFPSGNLGADMEKIRAFYATVTGKRPELASPAGCLP